MRGGGVGGGGEGGVCDLPFTGHVVQEAADGRVVAAGADHILSNVPAIQIARFAWGIASVDVDGGADGREDRTFRLDERGEQDING